MGGKSRKTGAVSKKLIERIKGKIPTKRPSELLREKKEGLLRELPSRA
jgi:hypothetical protein